MSTTAFGFADLVCNPDFYLWQFDEPHAIFARMDRDAYANSIFLDRRITALSDETIRVPLAELEKAHRSAPPAAGKPCFLFHIAHCGSTLLSRALDLRDKDLVYREPATLRQLAIAAIDRPRCEPRDEQWRRRLALASALLSKTYKRSAVAIIKANVPVNFIHDDLLTQVPGARAILLYSPLEEYLLAVLRTEQHRQWVGLLVEQMGEWLSEQVALPRERLMGLTEAEKAACLWFAQMGLFTDTLSRFDNVRSLASAALFKEPYEVINQCFKFIGLKVKANRVQQIVGGDLFKTYAKNHDRQRYDETERMARQKALKTQLSGELGEAREWCLERMAHVPLPEKLAKPLAGQAPRLM